jgi:hypothetical protein
MNLERPTQQANQSRVRYQPRRLRRTCAILASRFRAIGTFSAKFACIEPIGQGGPASREDRVPLGRPDGDETRPSVPHAAKALLAALDAEGEEDELDDVAGADCDAP